MFEYDRLNTKYKNEAPFNKMVNVFMDLIEKFGFTPSEIREALFLAQWKYALDVGASGTGWREYVLKKLEEET